MATDISLESVQASMMQFFNVNFSDSTTVWYPACRIDRASLDDWLEWRIMEFRRDSQRKANLDRFRILLRVKVVAKVTSNIYRAWRIHKAATLNTLTHAEIAVINFGTSATIGQVSLFEPRTTDNTRDSNHPLPHDSRTLTVEYRGWAQAI